MLILNFLYIFCLLTSPVFAHLGSTHNKALTSAAPPTVTSASWLMSIPFLSYDQAGGYIIAYEDLNLWPNGGLNRVRHNSSFLTNYHFDEFILLKPAASLNEPIVMGYTNRHNSGSGVFSELYVVSLEHRMTNGSSPLVASQKATLSDELNAITAAQLTNDVGALLVNKDNVFSFYDLKGGRKNIQFIGDVPTVNAYGKIKKIRHVEGSKYVAMTESHVFMIEIDSASFEARIQWRKCLATAQLVNKSINVSRNHILLEMVGSQVAVQAKMYALDLNSGIVVGAQDIPSSSMIVLGVDVVNDDGGFLVREGAHLLRYNFQDKNIQKMDDAFKPVQITSRQTKYYTNIPSTAADWANVRGFSPSAETSLDRFARLKGLSPHSITSSSTATAPTASGTQGTLNFNAAPASNAQPAQVSTASTASSKIIPTYSSYSRPTGGVFHPKMVSDILRESRPIQEIFAQAIEDDHRRFNLVDRSIVEEKASYRDEFLEKKEAGDGLSFKSHVPLGRFIFLMRRMKEYGLMQYLVPTLYRYKEEQKEYQAALLERGIDVDQWSQIGPNWKKFSLTDSFDLAGLFSHLEEVLKERRKQEGIELTVDCDKKAQQ